MTRSCTSVLEPETALGVDETRLDKTTSPLVSESRANMSGVYEVVSGSALIGETVVGRMVGDRFCLYSTHDVVHAEFVGGLAGDTVCFTGYIRYVRSGRGVHLDIEVRPHEGGADLVRGVVPMKLIIRGKTTNGDSLVLARTRDVRRTEPPFITIGHRCGGRNTERLGNSENSIELARRAEVLGASAIEVDAKATRDGHVIVFHDDTFSPRTIKGAYLLGKVGDFDLNQIQKYGRLIYGERIPTLEVFLREVIDSTELSLVWIDVKDAHATNSILEIQERAISYAMSRGRQIVIAFGIPTKDVLDAYSQSSSARSQPVICELGLQQTLDIATSIAWAPRWTAQISDSDLERCHASGRKVFVWTVNLRDFMIDFINNPKIDGILSDYPMLVTALEGAKP